jgi:hypothetical protein
MGSHHFTTLGFSLEKKTKRARTEEQSTYTQCPPGSSPLSPPSAEFDTGINNCLGDFCNAHAPKNPAVEEGTHDETNVELEQSTKKLYDTLFAAQKPVHPYTDVTQLDAFAHLMAFKCASNLSGIDSMIFSLLLAAFYHKGIC